MLSFRRKKQTSKNVADTTFKPGPAFECLIIEKRYKCHGIKIEKVCCMETTHSFCGC